MVPFFSILSSSSSTSSSGFVRNLTTTISLPYVYIPSPIGTYAVDFFQSSLILPGKVFSSSYQISIADFNQEMICTDKDSNLTVQ
ncbi:hypothetical protein L2E82_32371 [Cichorium intybus]|uniref:Uncharacterized protein n=1 Tax=Cichorium intybus TaxID=13427 RepID=A0ACB9BHU1_CICIN|nr:hypothetical protein L2E82_32371 [Cichorium intybus]